MMNDEEKDRHLRQMADSFINLANEYGEKQDNNFVNTAFMYGASRFSAFVAASQARNMEDFIGQREKAINFFTEEFRKMLESNMNNYEKVFQPQEELKYSEFMKDK